MNPIDIRYLPPRIQRIAKEVGMEATYAFLKAHGLELITIPPTYKEGCKLEEHVGKDMAIALIHLFDPGPMDVPKPDKLLQRWRNYEIYHDVEVKGMSNAEVVKKYNITRAWIHKVRQQVRAMLNDPKQPSDVPAEIQYNLPLDF